MDLSLHNTDQIRVSSRLTYFLQELLPFAKSLFYWLFSAVFLDIDFKFGIWMFHDMIQIMFEIVKLDQLLLE